MAISQTWSNYKQHNTVKFIVRIAPQGVVAFISKGWGERVSDVYLTENCGLLQNLLPGDLVLADRGFTLQESAGLYCTEVKVPPFTRGKKQLNRYFLKSIHHDNCLVLASTWKGLSESFGKSTQYWNPGYICTYLHDHVQCKKGH